MKNQMEYLQDGYRLNLKGGTGADINEELRTGSFKALSLGAGSWPDLSALIGKPLEGLVVSGDDVDWDSLYQVNGLKYLDIRFSYPEKVRFSAFSSLELLKTVWSAAFDENELQRCPLKALIVEEYLGRDLSKFPHLDKLVFAEFIRCRFESLAGIEKFDELQGLYLYSLPTLTDISALHSLQRMKSLEIDACKRIENHDAIGQVKSLEYLMIGGAGAIKSLEFIDKLQKLSYFAFGSGAIVVSQDLSPLLRQESLKRCRFTNSKGYNVKQKDIEMLLIERHGKLFEPEELIWPKPRRRV